MDTPKITTVLPDGTYGERDMTAEEIAQYEELIANAQEIPANDSAV